MVSERTGKTNSMYDFRKLLILQLVIVLCSAESAGFAQEPSARLEMSNVLDLAAVDEVVHKSLKSGELPGCVILVLHRDQVVFRKAYGSRSVLPARNAMGADTVFDLASLTKPLATATSIMLLAEQGKVSLSDKVVRYLPSFGQQGKDKITLEQLLLHTSGLIADNPAADYQHGKAVALQNICQLKPVAAPGERFTYSDVGYIVLGEIVERVTGQNLNAYTHSHIYAPLGMTSTTFLPQDPLRVRAAPTEKREGIFRAGDVHDPRAYRLGGVAGHAGLFSTADDIAKYARMLLRGGELDGQRILSPDSVRKMTAARTVPGGLRAFGWDVDTRFSSNRGDLFPRGQSFGHTGFTGTSIWIDPTSAAAVIFLSNRVHPEGKGNVNKLRGQVATIVAGALRAGQTPKTTTSNLDSSPTILDGILTPPQVTFREAEPIRAGRRFCRLACFSPVRGATSPDAGGPARRCWRGTGLP